MIQRHKGIPQSEDIHVESVKFKFQPCLTAAFNCHFYASTSIISDADNPCPGTFQSSLPPYSTLLMKNFERTGGQIAHVHVLRPSKTRRTNLVGVGLDNAC